MKPYWWVHRGLARTLGFLGLGVLWTVLWGTPGEAGVKVFISLLLSFYSLGILLITWDKDHNEPNLPWYRTIASSITAVIALWSLYGVALFYGAASSLHLSQAITGTISAFLVVAFREEP